MVIGISSRLAVILVVFGRSRLHRGLLLGFARVGLLEGREQFVEVAAGLGVGLGHGRRYVGTVPGVIDFGVAGGGGELLRVGDVRWLVDVVRRHILFVVDAV